jgi:hypothetical protein
MLSAFLQVGLSLLLWLQVPRVLALKGDSGCNKYMCLNATLNNDETITCTDLVVHLLQLH